MQEKKENRFVPRPPKWLLFVPLGLLAVYVTIQLVAVLDNRYETETAIQDTLTDSVQLDGGSRIDLGGIAKGYAADLCADILKDADADGLLVLGGNIYAVGTNEGKDWNIGIADPDEPTDTVAAVAMHDLSVVTSGDYERYFEQDGVRYHHIFDPETGYPAASGLRSVTVIDENSTRADALTTALFVMGADKGRAYCEKNGIAAVFITSDRQVFTTEKVSELCSFSFTGEDKGYTYAQ